MGSLLLILAFRRVIQSRRRRARAFLTALALCWAASAPAATTITVGYVPILAMSQLFVVEGEGWAKQAGIELKKVAFSEGPDIVQALGAGTVDVAYFGIGPAMVARSKGIDVRVVASNIVEHVAFLARGELMLYMLRDPKAGIPRFTAKKGRKPKIATFSKGSVPDTVLRYWLAQVAGLPADSLDIVTMGADRVQQALLDGSVDGASILEPIVTLVLANDKTAKVVLDGSDMMPNQPGAVLAMRSDFIRKRPEVVQKLVSLHNRATEFLILEPDRSARDIHAMIGKGPVTLEVISKAISSPYAKFTSDPYRIMQSTQVMHDFQLETGVLAKPVDLKDLFEVKFFNKLASGK